MELQDTIELMNSAEYKDRFKRQNTGRLKSDMTS